MKPYYFKAGNYFHPQGAKTILKVRVADINGIISEESKFFPSTHFSQNSADPVLLTADLLYSTPFQFIRHDKLGRWKTYRYEGLIIHFSSGGFHVNHEKGLKIYTGLHELQNICSSFLHKELPFICPIS